MSRSRWVALLTKATSWMVLSLGMVTTATADEWFVDDDANGLTADGLSWGTAFNDLRIALMHVSPGDVVKVAAGLYEPTLPGGNRALSFELRDGVTVEGGYAGQSGTDPNEREPALYRTVLSGDLNGDDDRHAFADNSFHVVMADGITDPRSRLDGVIIRGGRAVEDGGTSGTLGCCFNQRGGGLYALGSSFIVHDCTFVDNEAFGVGAGEGGGAYVTSDSSMVFSQCLFLENRASKGGGLYIRQSSVRSLDSRWIENEAAGGGGVFVFVGHASIEGGQFLGNRGDYRGGAVWTAASDVQFRSVRFRNNFGFEAGGAVHQLSSRGFYERCDFRSNKTMAWGAALYQRASTGDSEAVLVGCVVRDHQASALYNQFGPQGLTRVTLVSCALVDNDDAMVSENDIEVHVLASTITRNQRGLVQLIDTARTTVIGSILWGNGRETYADQIQGGQIVSAFNCIQGWTLSRGGDGNFSEDPQLRDDGYHLGLSSPCRDRLAGGLLGLSTVDVDGQCRELFGPWDIGADEIGPGRAPGAYEHFSR